MNAIVLGAGPGLGAALARGYASTGRKVAVVSRRADAAQALAEEVTADSAALGGSAIGMAADLSEPDQVATAIEGAARELGGLDVVHYNASLMVEGLPSQIALEDVERCWRVGCLGAWAALQASVPVLPAGGAFLVTGGGSALQPWAQGSALSSAKAAVRNFVFSAAKEITDFRVAMITVNAMIGSGISADEIARWFLALLEEQSPAVETMLPQA